MTYTTRKCDDVHCDVLIVDSKGEEVARAYTQEDADLIALMFNIRKESSI